MSADNKVKIAALGGIDDVLKAMREHPTVVAVQRHASRALRSLGVNS